MPIFSPPSEERISFRIPKVVFAFVASCLRKKNHDVNFLVP